MNRVSRRIDWSCSSYAYLESSEQDSKGWSFPRVSPSPFKRRKETFRSRKQKHRSDLPVFIPLSTSVKSNSRVSFRSRSELHGHDA